MIGFVLGFIIGFWIGVIGLATYGIRQARKMRGENND